MCIDSYVDHAFDFPPSVSLWVECADDAELERVVGKLSQGGQVMMPLDSHGSSTRFA